MSIVSVCIPQMGEGLQEARLVQFLKQPGDLIGRDEPIYVMETDKAVTEVESPYAGKLVAWLVEADSILPIGAEIARMEVTGEVTAPTAGHGASSPAAGQAAAAHRPPGHAGQVTTGNGDGGAPRGNLGVPIPPRTRKYLREKGLLQKADEIPAAGKKLLPDDIDRFLAAEARPALPGRAPAASAGDRDAYTEQPIPKTQQTLNFRMQRGADACIPAAIEIEVDWSHLAAARERTRKTTGETSFSMFVWCVVQAMRNHALLRSTISADGKTLRTYRHINIGIAVAVEDGLLRTAVVRSADRLNRESFASSLVAQIEKVRRGEDQVDATTTVSVSNIGASGVRMGIPVVVTPAVATLGLGEVYPRPFPLADGNGFQFRPVATVTLAFDHRVLNGVAAAEFLAEVRRLAESFTV